MNKLKIKAFLDAGKVVCVKWIYSHKYSSYPAFTGFISADYFSDFIISEGYKRIYGEISREEMSFLPYESSEKITKCLISKLKNETYKEILLADEMTMDFIVSLCLPQKIMKKVSVSTDALGFINDSFEASNAASKFNIGDVRGQLALIAHIKDSVKRIIDNGSLPDEVDESLLDDLYNLLAASGICWEVKSRYTKISEIGPSSLTIGGPLLTTSKDSWPGKNNYFFEPMCQIPTDLVRIFTDYSGSSGMAQFYFSDGIFSRVIEIGEPVSPPKEVIDAIINYRGDSTVYEILGIEPPKIYICNIDDELINNIDKIIGASELYLFSLLKMISEKNQVTNPHFMGSFYPIQYDPSAEEQCILALENELDVNFGDCGNGQVFLGRKGLYGRWSCY